MCGFVCCCSVVSRGLLTGSVCVMSVETHGCRNDSLSQEPLRWCVAHGVTNDVILTMREMSFAEFRDKALFSSPAEKKHIHPVPYKQKYAGNTLEGA